MFRLRRLVAIVALGYPLALLLIVGVLRFGTERFWQVELALYLPRVLFAAPLPVLTLILLGLRWWRLLWSQVVAMWIVLFPLMGVVLPGPPRTPHDAARTLRVLSWNGNFARGGQDALARDVRAIDPDVAVFQQLVFTDRLMSELAGSYPYRRTDGEFFIASRFPIRTAVIPPRVPIRNTTRSARFIHYELELPSGPITLYSVHPISPQYQLDAARSGGLRHVLRSGALFSLAPRPDIEGDRLLRALQTRTFAATAAQDPLPVIIAGDTNLPQLSAPLASLSPFRDGFKEAGCGFGYTFPSRYPWMRLDRIFVSERFRVLAFGVGQSGVSDHLPVYATIERTE